MPFCTHCGAQFHDSGNYCSGCGTSMRPTEERREVQRQPSGIPVPYFPSQPNLQQQHFSATGTHHAVARGFAQMFGLHPTVALVTVIVDSMIFGGAFVTAGTSEIVLSVPAGISIGFIAYRAQIKWYGDDKESAMIKALILAVLTAIPTSLPAFLYVPAGILGFFRRNKI